MMPVLKVGRRAGGPARRMRPAAAAMTCAAVALAGACGQKGAPLSPLHLVPAAATDVSIRRLASEVQLRFTIPVRNQNGPGRIDIDRVEIYAVTLAPGSETPPTREFLSSKYLVGSVSVKPAPVEGEPPAGNAAPDNRPAPGEIATFVERLTEEKLKPITIATAVTRPAPAAPAAAAAIPAPTYPVRIYTMRGITKRGRAGQPGPRVQMPIVTPPSPPTGLTATFTEQAVVLRWTPPAAGAEAAAPSFNVYKPDGASPLNAEPIAAAQYERTGIAFGTEQCFTVRTVEKIATASIESDATDQQCVTPRDTFPPAAPTGFQIVARPGAMNLIWNANTEPDIAGYVILRAEAPGDTLQPLTPTPIPGTSFEDTTVKAGVRYVYAVVAVDKAVPRNSSAPSARAEETAR